MSRATTKQAALEAMGALDEDNDSLVELGERKGVESGEGAVYFPYPQPFARNRGVAPGTSATIFLHPPTSAVIIIPDVGG